MNILDKLKSPFQRLIDLIDMWKYSVELNKIEMKITELSAKEIEMIRDKVIDEVKNVRNFATPEELSRLNLDLLNPEDDKQCVYGQLTGDCFGPRAAELLYFCANGTGLTDVDFDAKLLERKPSIKNGTKNGVQRYIRNKRKGYWDNEEVFSPLEFWIYVFKLDNAEIFNYLQGKTDEINLSSIL